MLCLTVISICMIWTSLLIYLFQRIRSFQQIMNMTICSLLLCIFIFVMVSTYPFYRKCIELNASREFDPCKHQQCWLLTLHTWSLIRLITQPASTDIILPRTACGGKNWICERICVGYVDMCMENNATCTDGKMTCSSGEPREVDGGGGGSSKKSGAVAVRGSLLWIVAAVQVVKKFLS